MTFNFEIISPEKVVYKEDVDEVIVPTTSGQLTILPNHAALMSQVASGEIIVKKNGKEYFMAISGGFLDVNNNNVSILADYAVRSEEIEVAHAIEAQKRAEKMMKESSEKSSKKDFAIAESMLRRSLLELKVASKRRRISQLPQTP
ncbi:MAG: ATP synthase F1 subunit epsilon [Candidatus Levybacteria bacterium RIFCSPHIGHO2_02_FULL_37_13]|nr:MAG: ATP synthase F1 subunit epsilon [Candidatus Levybacteria bacterium RIFCSPHIGHO2_02_FULL_37_13]OGH29170.1 MAG: ATP synthase F1 subunit epsilon [Candidatus Levybacteria bacterium RIFCSPHIGHO2_12_FULL_37_9]OGH37485.1 MAG: ATP synthase F1 subunit epsilon [Candidatus Levybacteria bacterium RIFCSPLOWO2_01_FULL_37_26]